VFVRVVQALGATSFLLAATYFWFPTLIIGRGVFLLAVFLVIAVVIGWRLVFDWLSSRVGPSERLLLVGTSAGAIALARELHEMRRQLGVEIVGFVDPDPAKLGSPVFNPGVVGTIDAIPAIVKRLHVDRVVVSLSDARGKLPMDLLLEMKLDGVTFDHLASVYEEYTGKIAVENLRRAGYLLVRVPQVGMAGRGQARPRSAGRFGGCRAGRARHGARGGGDPAELGRSRALPSGARRPSWTPFTVHKFRSMRMDAEADDRRRVGTTDDPRITPLGRFLRRTRLDELPQLWNVLKGDMSFVGPRPERPEFVRQLTEQIPFYGQRHVVRPGLTGWAQVRYTYGASVEDALMKLQYDLYYIKNLSLALDLYIIFSTIKTVVLRRGA
jgi:hypothetical protein